MQVTNSDRFPFYAAVIALCMLSPSVAMPQSETSTVLEEVTVTAERRQSTVQDTAAAITAFSAEQLARMGVQDARDIGSVSPAVTVTAQANIMQIYIRGVGNYASNTFAEGAVAFNMDGVYISRPGTYWGLVYDLERVEVLKGPQGTLYGRNATGGAINLISARPALGGGFDGYLNGEIGDYSAVAVNGALNIPVSERFALRGAFQYLDRNGYFADDLDDAGSLSGRLSGLWEPSEDVSLLVVADFQSVDANGPGGAITGINPFAAPSYLSSDPWGVGLTSPEANAVLAQFGRAPLGDPASYQDMDVWGIMAELNWDLGFATLTAIPAYRDSTNDLVNYAPGFLVDVDESSDQTSMEVRLASNESGFLDWVGGVYYFDESIDSDSYYLQQIVFFDPGKNSTRLNPTLDTTAWAAFGQLTFNLSDRLRLLAGARYTDEDKSMEGVNISNAPIPGTPPLTFPLRGDESWSKTTWKVGVEFDATDANLLYFNVGTGFKAGGFYAEQQQYGNSFEPEKITAYALGSKNRFLDNRLQVNAELFYWDYKEHQESHLALSPAFYSIFITENIGKAKIQGIDLEAELVVGNNGLLTFQGLYLDAEFTEFPFPGFSPGGPPLVGCPSTPLGGPFFLVNCDGKEAIRAPKWSGTVGYRHNFDFESGGRMVFDIRSQIADDTYTSIDYLPAAVAEGTTRTDASLTVYSPDDRLHVGVWIRNIEDDAVISGGFQSPFTSLVYSQLLPPRTYGVSFGVNF